MSSVPCSSSFRSLPAADSSSMTKPLSFRFTVTGAALIHAPPRSFTKNCGSFRRARAHPHAHTDYSFLVHSNGQRIIFVRADWAGWLQESPFSGHPLLAVPGFASIACKPCTAARRKQPSLHSLSVRRKSLVAARRIAIIFAEIFLKQPAKKKKKKKIADV